MQFTRASDYAVRVLVYLTNASGAVSRSQSIAAATGIPESFLAKILGQLSRSGLVHSHRGAHGGFTMAADAGRLTTLEVVEAMEGPLRMDLCTTPEPCSYIDRCEIQRVWSDAERSLRESLQSRTIAELARSCNETHTFGSNGVGKTEILTT
jgi:Rrf2 family protein